VYEIRGVGDGNTREIYEGGVDHVKIIAVCQNGRVREEAGADGVFVHFLIGTADFIQEPGIEFFTGSAAGEIPRDFIGGHKVPVPAERIHTAALHEITASLRISGHSSVVEDVPSVVVIDIKARSGIFDDIAQDLKRTDICCVERKGNVFRTDALVDEIGGFNEDAAN
jgi:hypothetical protein